MLSIIKNLFKKKPQENIEETIPIDDSINAAVILTISEENLISIDVDVKDFELDTIQSLSNILISLTSYEFQIEMLAIIKQGFEEAGCVEKFNTLLECIISTKDIKDEKDEPCINPSDVL